MKLEMKFPGICAARKGAFHLITRAWAFPQVGEMGKSEEGRIAGVGV
jgi:hypothetical protein